MADRSCTPAPSRRALFGAALASSALLAPSTALSSPAAELWRAARDEQRTAAEAFDLAKDTLASAEETAAANVPAVPEALIHRWRYYPQEEIFSEELISRPDIDRAYPAGLAHVPAMESRRAAALAALQTWEAECAAIEAQAGVPAAEEALEVAAARELAAFERLLAIVPPDAAGWAHTLRVIVERNTDGAADDVLALAQAATQETAR